MRELQLRRRRSKLYKVCYFKFKNMCYGAKNNIYLRAGFGEPLKPKEDPVEEEEDGKDGHGGDNQKVRYNGI